VFGCLVAGMPKEAASQAADETPCLFKEYIKINFVPQRR
jgi:hypothetical protein